MMHHLATTGASTFGPEVRFCVLEPRHAPALAELETAVFADAWSRARLAALLESESFLAVGGFDSRGMQAYLTAFNVAPELEIVNVAVRNALRRQGVGAMLVEFFLSEARKRGGTRVLLEVRAGNLGALALYRKCGFVQTGLRQRYYANTGEDALILERILS